MIITTVGDRRHGTGGRSPKRALASIVGCLALATALGACGSSTGTPEAAATTTIGPAPTTASAAASTTTATSASSTTTSVKTATTTTSVATAPATTVAASVAPTAAPAATAGPPTSLVFRSEHGAVPEGAIEVVANHSLFDVTTIEAPAGELVIHLSNIEELVVRHEFLITDEQKHRLARSDKVGQGEAVTLVVDDIKPGTYLYLCTIDGHDSAGMKGVLTVTDG